MIIREKEPANLEMPFGALDGFLTPNEQFYIRSHFPIPEVDPETWRLKIEGAVGQPRERTHQELLALPAKTISATLECAGNSRVFLVPKVKGTQWELGAVGNAEWTGVSLGDVLRQAGVKPSALEVILEGTDCGAIAEPPRPTGKVHFARSIPLGKAMDDVLLAWQMNGQPLAPAHGFPLRAIVPGWYGMAAVKWLQRIVVTERPFNGYYQTVDYAFWKKGIEGPTLIPITEMKVKAAIARPGSNAVIEAGTSYRVSGAAWTGNAEVAKVEVSTDGGASWQAASLGEEQARNCWRLWTYDWQVAKSAGRRVLMARATDSLGRTQPLERDPDRGTYEINHCLPIEVEIVTQASRLSG